MSDGLPARMGASSRTGHAAVITMPRESSAGYGRFRDVGECVLAFAGLGATAALVYAVNARIPGRPEPAVAVTAALLGVLALAPAAVYLVRRRTHADPVRVGLLLILGVLEALAGVYLYRALARAAFPADILSWSESDFVNDIIKLRTGYPLYTAQQNSDSFFYTPGTQILTFLIASLAGKAASIPFFRLVQIGFVVSAGAVSVFCSRRLLAMSEPGRHADLRGWTPVAFVLLFLFASNQVTNSFVQNLHNDGLAVLVTAIAYAVLLAYAADREAKWLVAMALIPAAGFLVKQNLVIWIALYGAYLVFFDRPRSWPRIVAYGAAAAACLAGVLLTALALWGRPFFYWTFTALSRHGVSPLRAAQHLFDAWMFYAAGLIGGAALLRGRVAPKLAGCWLVWLALILVETYTSGVAWMINHIGPGSLVAGMWFVAAIPLWNPTTYSERPSLGYRPEAWARTAIGVALLALSFPAFQFIRIPISPVSRDAYRYMREVEHEFDGLAPSDVLLDAGSWVYLQPGVVMKDRAASIAERGYSQSGDFSGMHQRLSEKRYAKVLVRGLNLPTFQYDDGSWQQSSGLRDRLLENYREVRRIRAVNVVTPGRAAPYLLSDISVLEPRVP